MFAASLHVLSTIPCFAVACFVSLFVDWKHLWISLHEHLCFSENFKCFMSLHMCFPSEPQLSFFQWFFFGAWCLSCLVLFCCWFTQPVAYATVCICNFITDASCWQQFQPCRVVCSSLISQEILSFVVFVVGNAWIYVCLCIVVYVTKASGIKVVVLVPSVMKHIQLLFMAVFMDFYDYVS